MCLERCFLFDDYNTYGDWGFITTRKSTPPPEPKTNYVDLGGVNGDLDLSEVLTGTPTYKNRTVSATFWSDEGTYDSRSHTLQCITAALHGKRMKIMEPDYQLGYFLGRVRITSMKNTLAYAEFSIEATCDPWRYDLVESHYVASVANGETKQFTVLNTGEKTLCPDLEVTGDISFTYDGITSEATTGAYKVSAFKLRPGYNTITVSGEGTLKMTYRRATL